MTSLLPSYSPASSPIIMHLMRRRHLHAPELILSFLGLHPSPFRQCYKWAAPEIRRETQLKLALSHFTIRFWLERHLNGYLTLTICVAKPTPSKSTLAPSTKPSQHGRMSIIPEELDAIPSIPDEDDLSPSPDSGHSEPIITPSDANEGIGEVYIHDPDSDTDERLPVYKHESSIQVSLPDVVSKPEPRLGRSTYESQRDVELGNDTIKPEGDARRLDDNTEANFSDLPDQSACPHRAPCRHVATPHPFRLPLFSPTPHLDDTQMEQDLDLLPEPSSTPTPIQTHTPRNLNSSNLSVALVGNPASTPKPNHTGPETAASLLDAILKDPLAGLGLENQILSSRAAETWPMLVNREAFQTYKQEYERVEMQESLVSWIGDIILHELGNHLYAHGGEYMRVIRDFVQRPGENIVVLFQSVCIVRVALQRMVATMQKDTALTFVDLERLERIMYFSTCYAYERLSKVGLVKWEVKQQIHRTPEWWLEEQDFVLNIVEGSGLPEGSLHMRWKELVRTFREEYKTQTQSKDMTRCAKRARVGAFLDEVESEFLNRQLAENEWHNYWAQISDVSTDGRSPETTWWILKENFQASLPH